MSRVLVTGATGFVGTQLVSALQAAGAEVWAALRATSQSEQGSRMPVLQFDLERPMEIQIEQLRHFDTIYHVAALVHVMRAGREIEACYERQNSLASAVLAQRAAAAGVRNFVYLSSIKVNGERTLREPFTRHDAPSPQDAYARSKLSAERALLREAAGTMRVVIVRPPLVYGPGVGANFRKLMALVNRGAPLPFGAIENRRSLVSVWNLVDFLTRCIANPAAAGGVWLISDGEDVSTPRLLNMVGRGLGKSPRLLRVPVQMLRAAGTIVGRRGEIDRLVESLQVDISDTRVTLGWQPPLGTEEAIARTAAWFRGLGRAA